MTEVEKAQEVWGEVRWTLQGKSRLFVVVALLITSVGCSGSGDELPPTAEGFAPVASGEALPCEHASMQDCTVKWELANGVTSCAKGRQVCDSGTWSDCLDDEQASELATALSLGGASGDE